MSFGSNAHRLSAIALALLGLLLLWLVVTHSFAAVLAPSNPNLALRLQADQPTALLQLSDSALLVELNRAQQSAAQEPTADTIRAGDGRLRGWAVFAQRAFGLSGTAGGEPAQQSITIDPQVAAQVQSWARRALLADPLNAHALALLGQVAEKDAVDRLMEAAVHRAVRESTAVYWLLRKYTEDKKYAAAMHQADLLLRTRYGMMPLVLPTLTLAADDPNTNPALSALLANNPPWRAEFLSQVTKKVPNPRTVLEILLALRETPAPPTPSELGHFTTQLIEKQDFELAYYTWLQFLHSDELRGAGLLYNGSFESAPTGSPFNWIAYAGSGSTIDLSRPLEGGAKHALYVEFGEGRVEFNGAAQVLMLPAGDYQLSGKFRGNLQGRRGLIWRVVCYGSSATLLTTPMVLGSVPDWTSFDIAFSVPANGCPAQRLRLDLDARSPSEQLISGYVFYDDMQISRSAAPATPASAETPAPAGDQAN